MRLTATALMLVALTGCATSQNVMLAQRAGAPAPTTAAIAPEEGNSPDMNEILTTSLISHGVSPKAPLPTGTRTSDAVDSIVSYSDVWRWDIVMYLKTVNISMFDAKTGNLLVSGRWDNSAFHGFKSARLVVDELVTEMLAKLKPSSSLAQKVAAQAVAQ